MSLAEYRTSEAVDVSLVDPFASRVLGLLEHFGGRVLMIAGRRDIAEQRRLYNLWLANLGNYAAYPGTSMHEKGQAADLVIVDDSVSWDDVHAEGERRGLKFPLKDHWDPKKREPWHTEPNAAWMPPTPEEPEDMTPQQMAQAFGGTLDEHGRIMMLVGENWYPIGNVISYILDEIQRDELLPTRIKRVMGS